MTEDKPVARLMQLAGPRPDPNPEVLNGAREAVEAEWRSLLARRRGRRVLLAASLVAATVTVCILGLRLFPHGGAPIWIGTMLGSRGTLHMKSPRGPTLSPAGEALLAGTQIETSVDGAAMFTLGSVALRLAGDSSVNLKNAQEVELRRGSLYVDSGRGSGAPAPLVVRSEFGAVRHRGTQYQVQALPGRYLFVAVREGEVQVSTAAGLTSLKPGEGLRIDATRQLVREHLAPYSEAWQWVRDDAPAVSIDDRPLSTLLDWYARESGLQLRFVAPATRAEADSTVLKGSVSGLSPRQALQAVLATTHFMADFRTPGELRITQAGTATLPADGGRPPTPDMHR